MGSRARKPSLVALVVFVAGLGGAGAAGVATYREVGLYGGPFASGFFREWDPVTRRRQLVHEHVTASGTRVRQLYADELKLQRTDISAGRVTMQVESVSGSGGVTGRVGFSLANDGVIDAWATSDPKGLTRIEISTRRNGRVDRWEVYDKKRLLRVDLDTNGNGKPDRWMTYQDGIPIETFIDADEDGQPDDHKR
jgi:hypothetical protein